MKSLEPLRWINLALPLMLAGALVAQATAHEAPPPAFRSDGLGGCAVMGAIKADAASSVFVLQIAAYPQQFGPLEPGQVVQVHQLSYVDAAHPERMPQAALAGRVGGAQFTKYSALLPVPQPGETHQLLAAADGMPCSGDIEIGLLSTEPQPPATDG